MKPRKFLARNLGEAMVMAYHLMSLARWYSFGVLNNGSTFNPDSQYVITTEGQLDPTIFKLDLELRS